jgi:hypothetical protein
VRIFSGASLASEKSYALPAVHQSLCVGTDGGVPVPDTNFSAPLDVRLATYPDWHALGFEEDWQFVWEGLLSNDRTDGRRSTASGCAPAWSTSAAAASASSTPARCRRRRRRATS